MDRNHRGHAAAWDVVANATTLHRRNTGKWHIRRKQRASGSAPMSASNLGPSLIAPNVGVTSHGLHLSHDASWDAPMRNALQGWPHVALIVSLVSQPALAKDVCDAQSTKGDICLCKLSDLHPTQASVGMAEVRIKAEKLKDEIQRRSESGFLKYLVRHDKEEPVIIGPGGNFYITDHHHLARALYEVGASTTYCTIVDNLSDAKADDFWKHLKDNNEVYMEDQNGNTIKHNDIPNSVKELRNDPFRSLAGAVRESCGFEKDDKSSSGEDYLEFQWADYLRAHWAQTSIATKDIDTNFDSATDAALHLAAEKDAASLPGYTGKMSCD